MEKQKVVIVGFGASFTEAKEMSDESKKWLNILGRKLQKEFPEHEFDIINSGRGGKSARELMTGFEKEVLANKPDFVILDLCANNMSPARPEEDRVDLKEFKSILEEYKSSLPPKTKTVLFTPPPVYEDIHPYGKITEFKAFYQQHGGFGKSRYGDIFRNFARENNFPIYDLYNELLALGGKNGRERYIFKDGIHLNEESNKILAEGIFELLKKLILEASND